MPWWFTCGITCALWLRPEASPAPAFPTKGTHRLRAPRSRTRHSLCTSSKTALRPATSPERGAMRPCGRARTTITTNTDWNRLAGTTGATLRSATQTCSRETQIAWPPLSATAWRSWQAPWTTRLARPRRQTQDARAGGIQRVPRVPLFRGGGGVDGDSGGRTDHRSDTQTRIGRRQGSAAALPGGDWSVHRAIDCREGYGAGRGIRVCAERRRHDRRARRGSPAGLGPGRSPERIERRTGLHRPRLS